MSLIAFNPLSLNLYPLSLPYPHSQSQAPRHVHTDDQRRTTVCHMESEAGWQLNDTDSLYHPGSSWLLKVNCFVGLVWTAHLGINSYSCVTIYFRITLDSPITDLRQGYCPIIIEAAGLEKTFKIIKSNHSPSIEDTVFTLCGHTEVEMEPGWKLLIQFLIHRSYSNPITFCRS